MMTRREVDRRLFLSVLAAGTAACGAPRHQRSPASALLPESDDGWEEIARLFPRTPGDLVYLDNGFVGKAPRAVVERMVAAVKFELESGRVALDDEAAEERLRPVREGLARIAGTRVDEIALVRNATEALATVLLGMPLAAGDVIAAGTHEYWAMYDALSERSRRDGVVIQRVDMPHPRPTDEHIVEAFDRALTPRTRLLLVSHMVNLTGQIMPVRALSELAHSRGIQVLVDGAQSFAHLTDPLPELGCDFWGTSLHKWMTAPIGTGLLYVRRDLVETIPPLVPTQRPFADTMGKYENSGTRTHTAALAVAPAIEFHERVGGERKQARLRELREQWARPIGELPGVTFLARPESSCGIGAFRVEGRDGQSLVAALRDRFGIVVQPVSARHDPRVDGVRVTPGLHTTQADLQSFVEAMGELL